MIARSGIIAKAAWPLILLSAPSLAAPGAEASASGTATAQVIAPLRLDAVSPLEFGTIAVAPSGGGAIIVAPSGASPTYTGTLQAACGASALCNAQPAEFAVRGEPGRYYRVEYPAEAMAELTTLPASALRVTQITVATDSLAGEGGRGLLSQGGLDGFRIGGTLEVPGGTAAGRYRATLNVVVTYD